jgi:hypothetical protein
VTVRRKIWSNDRSIVSVTTNVPVTKATPNRTASVVNASRSLRAMMPLSMVVHIAGHLGRPRPAWRGAARPVVTMPIRPGGAHGSARRPAGDRDRRPWCS